MDRLALDLPVKLRAVLIRSLVVACALAPTGWAYAASADAVSASPDAPAVEVGWRMAVRAKVGLRIQVAAPAGDASGLLLEIPCLIELHNHAGSGAVVPYEYWRARLALGGGYRWRWPTWTLDGLLLLEHESDHVTGKNQMTASPPSGFVNLNDVALSARAAHLARHPTWIQGTVRLHLLTCTASPVGCGAGGGLAGDQTVEFSGEASQQLTLDADGRWALFASLAADALVPTELIAPGRRVALRLGGLLRRARDSWTVSLYGLAGNDVGYLRAQDVLQAGVMLAWTLN